jgi:hypothetical protein
MKYNQKVIVPVGTKSGGSPSCPLFYQNPQYYFNFDKTKVPNPAIVDKIDTIITYQSDT